jgi:hypothetical protein
MSLDALLAREAWRNSPGKNRQWDFVARQKQRQGACDASATSPGASSIPWLLTLLLFIDVDKRL